MWRSPPLTRAGRGGGGGATVPGASLVPVESNPRQQADDHGPVDPLLPTLDGPASGQVGQGNSRVPRQQERRSRWITGGRTCAATTGTPCCRPQMATDLVTTVLTVLCQRCPLRASVAAVGLDERVRAGASRLEIPVGVEFRLQQAQLAGTCDSFGAPLDV